MVFLHFFYLMELLHHHFISLEQMLLFRLHHIADLVFDNDDVILDVS